MGIWDSINTPAVVMRPILLPPVQEPQGAVRPRRDIPGRLFEVGIGYSMNTPAVVMRPILLPDLSVNHSAPSGPVVMPIGSLFNVGIENSVITPAVVMRPMLPPLIFGEPQRSVRSGCDAFGRAERVWGARIQ